MSRLAQGLSAVEITAASGFGRDTFVYKDLDQRTRWRPNGAGAMSREFLAQYGTVNLCTLRGCTDRPCIILNGAGRTTMPLDAFYVDDLGLVGKLGIARMSGFVAADAADWAADHLRDVDAERLDAKRSHAEAVARSNRGSEGCCHIIAALGTHMITSVPATD
jgi:hypothetical protein